MNSAMNKAAFPGAGEFSLLTDHMPQGVACGMVLQSDAGPEVVYLYRNPAYQRQTGSAPLPESLRACFAGACAHGTAGQLELLLGDEPQPYSVEVFSPRPGHFAAVVTSQDTLTPSVLERRALEVSRAEALARLEKIANRVPGLVYQFVMRPDGTFFIPFASGAIRDVFRVTPEEVREDASKVFAALHPDDLDAVFASIRKSADELGPWVQEFRVKFEDGAVHWLLGNALPERDEADNILWHGFITDISERKRAESIYQGLFEQSIFLAGILDHEGRMIDVNHVALELAGVSREAILGTYFPDTPWWNSPTDREKLVRALQQALQGTATSFEATHPTRDGNNVTVMFNAMPIFLESGTQVAVVGVDISERKRAEAALQKSEQRFRDFFEQNSSVMLLLDPVSGEIIDANLAAADFYGYPRATLVTMSVNDLNTLTPEGVVAAQQSAQRNQRNYVLFTHRLASGELRHVEVRSTPIESGGRPLLFSIVHDITDRTRLEEQVRQLAFYDPLTHLPNRRLLNDRLEQVIAAAKRKASYGALMFLDLDNFKPLNDLHGHEVGDLLLLEVSNRVKTCVRGSDTVARFGGDEFVVLLGDVDASQTACLAQAQTVAEKIRLTLAEPYHLGVQREDRLEATVEHRCTASIGVCVFSGSQTQQEDILQHADAAMYQAKDEGRNRVRVYAPTD